MTIQIPFPIPNHGVAQNSKLRVNLDYIVSKFNEFNTGTAAWDNVSIGTAGSLTGPLTFYNASNTNYLTLQAGATDVSVIYTLPAIRPAGIASGTVYLTCDSVTNAMAWSGGGAFAPSNESYVVMALTTGLANERKLTSGTGITLSDGGAGGNATIANSGVISLIATANQTTVSSATGNVTIGTVQDIGTSSNVTFGTLKVGAGDATNNALQINDANTGFYQAGSVGNINLSLDGNITTIWTKADSMLWNAGPVKTSSLILRDSAGANPTVTVNPPSGFTSYTLTMPVDDGTPSQVLTTDGSGVLSWTTPSGTGANTALSNLASVAINLALLPGTDNSIDLGSSSKRWVNLFAKDLNAGASGTAGSLSVFPATASKGKLLFSAADSGGNFTTTITNTSQAAARTYTIPDAGASANFVLTESGSGQTINGFLTFSSALSLTATANQLVLSGPTRTVTISAAQPATASRTHTIPDVSASASFVMTEGAQTINGAKTLGAALALGSNKITGLAAATAAGDAVRYEQWHVAANVVYANTTSVTATSSTSLADITNLTASITPSSSSNKVLVRGMINIAVFPTSGNSQDVVVTLTDGSNTSMLQCDALVGGGGAILAGEYIQATCPFEYLDSPATTSAKTYKFRVALAQASTNGTATVNYAAGAGGSNPTYSSITLQEIPA